MLHAIEEAQPSIKMCRAKFYPQMALAAKLDFSLKNQDQIKMLKPSDFWSLRYDVPASYEPQILTVIGLL